MSVISLDFLPSALIVAGRAHRLRNADWPHGSPSLRRPRRLESHADAEWRLARIPSLEIGIYALGRLEFAGLFEGQSEFEHVLNNDPLDRITSWSITKSGTAPSVSQVEAAYCRWSGRFAMTKCAL